MKVIVTIQNKDGSYDEVGMNNKALISHLKANWAIKRWAKEFSRNKPHRIEYFSNIYADPDRVEYVT